MTHSVPLLPGGSAAPGKSASLTAEPLTLGVMGGGQLGRMFVHAAQTMGYFTAVLDPDAQSPAGHVSHRHIQTDYTDPSGLKELSECSAAITTEFENVPAWALRELAKLRPVSPGADAVAIAQDRAAEKAHFVKCGVPCAPYAVIESADQLAAAINQNLLPGILKTARMGYDGKGQVRVKDAAALRAAWRDLKQVPCVLEKMLPLSLECSVIVARGRDGQMVNFPAQRNLHREGILAVTEVYEGHMPETLQQQAVAAARAIADGMNYVGVLCTEFFVLQDGSMVVNEMAPRPHNSGHYTLDACDQSQFDLQVRALAGLPLTQPRQHSQAIMLNLLGDVWFDTKGVARFPDWTAVLALQGTHLHLYGKSEARKARKMGHLNVTGTSAAEVRQVALKAAGILGIEAF